VKKTKVIVLFGGRSAEHEISLLSARNVVAALDRARFEPVLVGIDRQGRWHRESERTLAAAAGDPRGLELDAAAPTVGIEEGLAAATRPGGALEWAAGDDVVVFPVLHGTFGEDGTVQGLLELAGVAYVGAGALAFDRKVLLERAVDAREIECAVLGNDAPEASIPGEILVHHRDGFYSYDAKYVDAEGASWKIPADLPPAVTARVRELAVATFRTLELAGMARVDFFLARDTGALYVNEVNTIPGFTAVSMYPKMWEATGLSASALISRLVDLAIERRDARRALVTAPPKP